MLSHRFMPGLCHNSATLFLAHSFDTSIQFRRSFGALSLAKILISNSAGRRATGDTRHLSSYSILAAAFCDVSEDISTPNEEAESLGCSMKESLSSSALRSGEVDDEEELDALDMRRRFLERDMVGVQATLQRVVLSDVVARRA